MFKSVKLLFIAFPALLFISCRDDFRDKAIYAQKNKQIRDSLIATRGHGYYCTYYIRGKIRISQIFDHHPFQIEVEKVSEDFLEKDIAFVFTSARHFNIECKNGQKLLSAPGTFGEKLETPVLTVNAVNNSRESDTRYLAGNSVAYFFRVHRY